MKNIGVFSSFLNTSKQGQSKFYYDTIFNPIIDNIYQNTQDKYVYFFSQLTKNNTNKFLSGHNQHFNVVSFNAKDYTYKQIEYYKTFQEHVREKIKDLDMDYCFVVCSPYLPIFPRNKTNYHRFIESGKTPIIGHLRRNFYSEIIIEELSKVTKIVYLQFDPNEEGFEGNSNFNKNNQFKKYFYDYDKFNYFPYYEKEYKEKYVNKKYDLSFSTLLLTPERKRYNLSRLKKIEENLDMVGDQLNSNFMYFTQDNKEDLIPKNEYDEMVKQSKYTYILPSYNNIHFSYPRFYDAIMDQTIPLIDDRVNLEILKENHKHWYDWIHKNKLIVNGESLVDTILNIDYESVNKEAIAISKIAYSSESFKKHYMRLDKDVENFKKLPEKIEKFIK